MKNEVLRRAWAEIHLDRLERNVEKCRSLISPDAEIMCAVKANCYGHGCEGIIPRLEDLGINWFAVSNIVEAEELRSLGVSGEILILGYTPPEDAGELIEYDIIQTITDLEYAGKLAFNAPRGERVRCHIAVDTGMNRIGLNYGDDFKKIADDAERIVRLEGLEVEGLFTHLPVADSLDEENIDFTNHQIELVCEVRDELKKRLVLIDKLHFLNSAGAMYHYDERSDLVRFGIMLYGLKPDFLREMPVKLEPVMELKSIVSQIKTLPSGVTIGYGRTYKTEKETKVATVTIGYADGCPRLLSNKGELLLHGKRAKILGRVCMDQLMIDVTDIPEAMVGDTVTLIGRDGDEEITADEIGELCGTIGYEIVCGISQRVPRIFIS
ncbi:MAG: alanine racemase [Oscillospiraceae bacterium]|nr:alanine racemase [Oscillospiraceae bacterium]